MYKIVFNFYNRPSEVYSGKTCYNNKQKLAVFCPWAPKLFSTAYQAEKTAKHLISTCINCSDNLKNFEILEATELDVKRNYKSN